MDIFLAKVTQQAMNYAIRSGITITAGYAIKQSSRLLKNVEGNVKEELQTLQERLDSKIRIISPAIDMIELISARGNTSLESAVSLTKSLRWAIQALGRRLAIAATAEELTRRRSSKGKSKEQNELELKLIAQDIRKLLNRIDDAVPLINLAITTSGASLSTNLPSTVSPSRLLQASTFITAGDTQYSMKPSISVQIGPTFTLSLYMLFQGHLRPQDEEDVRQSTWKEVIHKARIKLVRVPLDALYEESRKPINPINGRRVDEDNSNSPLRRSVEKNNYFPPLVEADAKADEYAYQLVIVEDLDDDRMHTFDETEAQPGPYDDVDMAGIREIVPIHEISKIFYADTRKILNIPSEGEENSPVLLLKRDLNAIPPRRMMERFSHDQPEDHEDDTFNEDNHQSTPNDHDRYQHQSEIDAQLEREHRSSSLVRLSSPSLVPLPSSSPPLPDIHNHWRIPADLDPEWLAFQVYTSAPDSDSDSISDSEAVSSQPARAPSLDPSLTTALTHLNIAPRRKVGFDPYDESPVKRRGEDYQNQHHYHRDAQSSQVGWDASPGYDRYGSPRPDDGAEGDWITPRTPSLPPHALSRRPGQAHTPGMSPLPLLLKDRRMQSSSPRDTTPEPSHLETGPSLPSATPEEIGAGRMRALKREVERRGSPLARVGLEGVVQGEHQDEGLGTSPGSGFGEGEVAGKGG
ncbi:GTP-binding nuclear protein Ran-related [Lasallia pustulata]|uniref:GTP-binding nuclear protein Ran-related n=1 Tax=Lasallia pustulata TaxID=136370 RepID=A0A1W5D0Z1_9LECA|nr:GTP-binding nuclear protein Ran-related [Lasallia pustulata]